MMELPWVQASSALAPSPARGTPRWSQGTLLAYLTEDECHVIDMQAALEKTGEAWLVRKFKVAEAKEKGIKRNRTDLPLAEHVLHTKPVPCSMSWSPSLKEGFLLALADTSGRVQIFAPCAASERLLVADLTEEFRSKATLVTPLVEVRFAPQDFGLGAVLCASRGCTVMIWSIGECEEKRDRGLLPRLLKCISLEDGALGANIITSMDLSWNWGQVKHAKVKSNKEANVLLALGTNHGHLITKKLTCKSAQSNATLTVSPLEQIEVESTVTDVVVYSDPAADGTDFVIAIAQGIKVSAVVIHASFSGRESLRHYAAGPPCHGMPIVSVCCDTAGVFSACNKETGSFVERVNVVSMDSTGHTVIWQLSEGDGGILVPSQLCSLAARTVQNYFTAIEQAAIFMETRPVRAAAREKEAAHEGKLLCGFSMSPNHCMLVTQSTIPSARTTQLRPVTFLLATALGTPSHAFTAMLRYVGHTLRASHGQNFHLSLWDVHEAWRSMLFGASRSATMTREPAAMELPCAILEAALSWLWDLQEAFGKAYVNISEQTLSSAQKAASSASCKVPLLLRHTAANGVSVSAYIASSKSLTERWATATTRQRHFLNMLREELADVDDLVLCQLRNAWLELGRNATRERTQRKYIYAEPPKTQRSLQAATCAYWEQRAKNGLKNGLAKASAVQGFLAEVEDIQRPKQSQESPSFSPGSACQLCGMPMVVDSTLTQASCGKHKFPLCQRDLRPLLSEPHLLCSFCGRCTQLAEGDPPICAWCASICS